MNRDQTTRLLSTLRAVWSNEEITPEKIEAYHWALSDVSYPAVEQAVKTLLRSAKFFPKPAEILELIVAEAFPQRSSGECWEIVQKQIRSHGYQGWESVDFGDDVILTAAKAVTWRRICLDEDQQFIRRDFDRALEVSQLRQRRDMQSGAVAIEGPKMPEITIVELGRS